MAPVTITIDTDSEPESPKISKSKSKTKTTVIESSSPFHNLSSSSQADLTLPDAALLFGLKAIKQPLKSTSLSNNHVKPSKTKASSGKFRYAGLQNLSSPPPGLDAATSSPIQDFTDEGSQPAPKNSIKNSTLNRLDSNTGFGLNGIRNGSGSGSGQVMLGKKTSSSSILNGLDALKGGTQLEFEDGNGTGSSKSNSNGFNLVKKSISLPSKTNNNMRSNSEVPINLCDSDSEQEERYEDGMDEENLPIRAPVPSKSKSKGKGKGKGKESRKSLVLGESDPFNNEEDDDEERLQHWNSPVKKKKQPTKESELELDEEFGMDISLTGLEVQMKVTNEKRTSKSRGSSPDKNGKGKGKQKERGNSTGLDSKKDKKKRELNSDSDDSIDWDAAPTVKKGKMSTAGTSTEAHVDKGKGKVSSVEGKAADSQSIPSLAHSVHVPSQNTFTNLVGYRHVYKSCHCRSQAS